MEFAKELNLNIIWVFLEVEEKNVEDESRIYKSERPKLMRFHVTTVWLIN